MPGNLKPDMIMHDALEWYKGKGKVAARTENGKVALQTENGKVALQTKNGKVITGLANGMVIVGWVGIRLAPGLKNGQMYKRDVSDSASHLQPWSTRSEHYRNIFW